MYKASVTIFCFFWGFIIHRFEVKLLEDKPVLYKKLYPLLKLNNRLGVSFTKNPKTLSSGSIIFRCASIIAAAIQIPPISVNICFSHIDRWVASRSALKTHVFVSCCLLSMRTLRHKQLSKKHT